MLVLYRKEDDKILFPNLGISVQILRVDGNKVRVGVDAPPEVKILRHELAADDALASQAPPARGSRKKAMANHDEHVRGAAQALSDLYDISGKDLDKKSERLILDVFHHLKAIDEQVFQKQSTEQNRPAKKMANRCALLVEDNLNESRLLAGYLRTKQFDVTVAGNGQEALNYLNEHPSPDIVLLDMQMPGMDGPTTIRKVRADKRNDSLKVFAVSGGNPTEYGVSIGPQGVDAWFPKPLDPEALVFRLAFESEAPRNPRRATMVANN